MIEATRLRAVALAWNWNMRPEKKANLDSRCLDKVVISSQFTNCNPFQVFLPHQLMKLRFLVDLQVRAPGSFG